MDINKLLEKVLQSVDLQEIPEIYVCIVFNAFIEAISTGECFITTE